MSLEASLFAWSAPCASTDKLVLLALADHADRDGVCWPGLRGVSEKVGFDHRTVRRSVRRLEEAGLLKVEPREAPWGGPAPSLYRLQMPPPPGAAPPPSGRSAPTLRAVRPEGYILENLPYESPIKPVGVVQPPTAADSVPGNGLEAPEALLEAWNRNAKASQAKGLPGMHTALDLTADRRKKAIARLGEASIEWHEQAMRKLALSRFACGGGPPQKEGQKAWRASIDWYLANETNPVKAYEGRYDG